MSRRQSKSLPRVVRGGGFGVGAAAEDVGVPASALQAAIRDGDLTTDENGLITVAALGEWFSTYATEHPEATRKYYDD